MDKINQVNFFQKNNITPMQLSGSISAENTPKESFKDVFMGLVNEVNETTKKPEQLQIDMMQGKADIHDLMVAVAQSELTVQAATTITGKILQSYEKIMQIQI